MSKTLILVPANDALLNDIKINDFVNLTSIFTQKTAFLSKISKENYIL